MPQRNYSTDKTLTAKPSHRIVLPIPRQIYHELTTNCDVYREYVDAMVTSCPELFPTEIKQGYTWHDSYHSKKMPEISVRRIKLSALDDNGKAKVLTLVPSFIMPYMCGDTDEIEKALFLRRFGVPYWGLTYVFGHNDMYWYRQIERLGRYDLVGTTLKSPDVMPEHLLADEKHTRFNGEKAYIATTVAEDCVLGASFSLSADTVGLTEAYSHFKQEAQRVKSDYQAQTVNTDGWSATQKAWQALFPAIVIVQCFLHAFISIRSRCKKLAEFPQLCQHIWNVYHAPTVDAFYEQVAELYAWAQPRLTGYPWQAVQKLCRKTGEFLVAFEYPDAYRTSNMIDRHMIPMDRCLDSARYFHGHLMSAEFQIRAGALMHNFLPYCPRANIRRQYQSPAHKLNGFVYHDNWLHNLLISTSGQAVYAHHKKREN